MYTYLVPNSLFSNNINDNENTKANIINETWNTDILVLENVFGNVCYISKLKFKELHKNKQIIILINKKLLY
jgi:hypothetical protein